MECVSATPTDAASEEASTGAASPASGQVERVLKEKRMVDDSTIPGAQQPTEAVLMSEVHYGIVFAELNELANSRLHKLCVWMTTFFGILSGSGLGVVVFKIATQVGYDQSLLVISLVIGLLAAAAEATRRTYRFNEEARKFRTAKNAFQELEARGWAMNLGNLQKEIVRLRKTAPSTGGWLADVAYNKACEELGYREPQWRRPVRPMISAVSHALAG